MRAAVVVVVIIGSVHLADRFANHGYYSDVVLGEAQGYLHYLNDSVDRWVKRMR